MFLSMSGMPMYICMHVCMYVQMSACDFLLNSDTRPQGPKVIYNLQFRHLADSLNPERLTMA